ncbi:MAG TPA: hypothetical protein VEA37_01675 [Flavobacterium sp.]|nr:hypothetical protein [Flavobacterium sp.]
MVESKFKFTVYIAPIFALAILLLLVCLIANKFEDFTSIGGGIFVSTLLFFSLIMFMADIRTKAIAIDFYEDDIRIRPFIGLGRQKIYRIGELDGFQSSIINSKGGTYLILYLMKDNRKVGKITEFYHSNYNEIHEFCVRNLKDLGSVRTNIITEIKDILK